MCVKDTEELLVCVQVLARVSEELPELHDMFLRYKQLKKMIKSLPRGAGQAAGGEEGAAARSTTPPAAAAPQPSTEQVKHSPSVWSTAWHG